MECRQESEWAIDRCRLPTRWEVVFFSISGVFAFSVFIVFVTMKTQEFIGEPFFRCENFAMEKSEE